MAVLASGKLCDLNNCERTPEVETLRSQISFYSRFMMFCLGVIVTLAGVYFTTIKNAVSRLEVDDMISRHPTVVTMKEKMDYIAATQGVQLGRLD